MADPRIHGEGNQVNITNGAMKKHLKADGKSVYLASIRFNSLCANQYFHGAVQDILKFKKSGSLTIVVVDTPQIANLIEENPELNTQELLLEAVNKELYKWWFGEGEVGLACAALLLKETFPGKALYFATDQIAYDKVKADYLQRAFGSCNTVVEAVAKFNEKAAKDGIQCEIKLWSQWLKSGDKPPHLKDIVEICETTDLDLIANLNELVVHLVKKLSVKFSDENNKVLTAIVSDALDFALRKMEVEITKRKELYAQSISNVVNDEEMKEEFVKKLNASINFLLFEARPLIAGINELDCDGTAYPGSQYGSFIAVEEDLKIDRTIETKRGWYDLRFNLKKNAALEKEIQEKVKELFPQVSSQTDFFKLPSPGIQSFSSSALASTSTNSSRTASTNTSPSSSAGPSSSKLPSSPVKIKARVLSSHSSDSESSKTRHIDVDELRQELEKIKAERDAAQKEAQVLRAELENIKNSPTQESYLPVRPGSAPPALETSSYTQSYGIWQLPCQVK